MSSVRIERGGNQVSGASEEAPSCCSAKNVSRFAALFFVLSAGALGALYGMNTTQYILVPYVTGGVSFVVFVAARVKMLCNSYASVSPSVAAPVAEEANDAAAPAEPDVKHDVKVDVKSSVPVTPPPPPPPEKVTTLAQWLTQPNPVYLGEINIYSRTEHDQNKPLFEKIQEIILRDFQNFTASARRNASFDPVYKMREFLWSHRDEFAELLLASDHRLLYGIERPWTYPFSIDKNLFDEVESSGGSLKVRVAPISLLVMELRIILRNIQGGN